MQRALRDLLARLAPLPGGGWREMKVLIACEESQIECKAFRAKGHEAYPATFRNPAEDTRSGTSWGMLSRPSRGGK